MMNKNIYTNKLQCKKKGKNNKIKTKNSKSLKKATNKNNDNQCLSDMRHKSTCQLSGNIHCQVSQQ